MKRHAALQDLSRDHFTALLACLQVARAREGHEHAKELAVATGNLLSLWHRELKDHFDEEEVNLLPYLGAHDVAAVNLAERLRREHDEIRAAFAALESKGSDTRWGDAAEALRAHIRWEEDDFFEWLQDNLTDDELGTLLAASVAFRMERRGRDSVQAPRP